MDAFAAGQLTRSLDAVHSASYFVPAAAEKFGAARHAGPDGVVADWWFSTAAK
jgi:hypothetical protein